MLFNKNAKISREIGCFLLPSRSILISHSIQKLQELPETLAHLVKSFGKPLEIFLGSFPAKDKRKEFLQTNASNLHLRTRNETLTSNSSRQSVDTISIKTMALLLVRGWKLMTSESEVRWVMDGG